MDEPIKDQQLFEFFMQKHKELMDKTQISKDDIVALQELNDRLSTIAGDRGWAVTEYHLADQKLKDKKREYKQWEECKLLEARKAIKSLEDKIKDMPRWMIDAKITETDGETKYKLIKEIDELETRVAFYKDFKEIWSDQINTLQTHSSNIRSDVQYRDYVKANGGNNNSSLHRLKNAIDNK